MLCLPALSCVFPSRASGYLSESRKEKGSGGILQVLSTDPGSVADFEAFCRHAG